MDFTVMIDHPNCGQIKTTAPGSGRRSLVKAIDRLYAQDDAGRMVDGEYMRYYCLDLAIDNFSVTWTDMLLGQPMQAWVSPVVQTGIKRIDPPDCGCLDCIPGQYSKPINECSQHELMLCFKGEIGDASGLELAIGVADPVSGKVCSPDELDA